MSELVTKVAEVASKGAETKSSFDPDKKIGKGEVSNTNEAKSKDNGYDPDKKVDKSTPETQEQKGLTDEQKEQIRKETA